MLYPDDSSNSVASVGLCGPGDLDGDGIDDLIIGNPLDDSNGIDAGAVHLFQGPITGNSLYSDASVVLYGEDAQDYTGSIVSGIAVGGM